MENQRKCIICGNTFEKPVNCSKKEWEESRKTCSKKCGYTYRGSTHTIWNKGLTKETSEVVKLISEKQKGKRGPISEKFKGENHHLFGKKHTKEWKNEARIRNSGENHWNWQGGKTDKIHALRQKVEYQEWKLKVYERDSYECQRCGAKTNLHAHHIEGFKENELLRYEVSNGITLCSSCHKKTHHELNKTLNL